MSGLQLSGLASGMDWQSVVEQLMELERFPIRRMEAEKVTNDQKNVELSILSSRLGQLSTAAKNLTDSSIWNARSVELSDPDTSLVSVSASTGTLTGEYVISDATRASASVLYGNTDMTANITGASVIDTMDVSSAIYEGTFSINGTIFTVNDTGGTGGTDINLDEDLSTAAATIVAAIADISGAGVTDGKFYLDASSDIILGHPDDTSNFLSVLKLFSQSEANYNTAFGVYAEAESAATTSTTKTHRQGDFVYDTNGYYPVLQDAPRGADLSGAPNSYFGDLIPNTHAAYKVTGLDGDGSDFIQITINGQVEIVPWQGTAAATAAELKTTIDANALINTDVFVSVVGDDLIISEQSAGDIASLTTTAINGGGAVAAAVSDSQVFDGSQVAPDGYHVRSEFPIGSVDVSDSIRDALGSLADGTYEFDINGQSFTVKNSADTTNGEIDMDNTTMQQFMDKITASNAGVTMSYNPIEDRFSLTSKVTGELKVTATDTSNSLLQTMYLDSEVSGNGTLDLGVDATLTINGTVVTSNRNEVTGTAHGIEGLTITIKEDFDASDADLTLTVASDISAAEAAINTFISDYNAMQQHLVSVTETITTDTDVETSIFSDNLEVSNLISSLRAAVFGDQNSVNPVTMEGSGVELITDIGIDFTPGSAELRIEDSSLLQEMLEENGSQVQELFASSIDTPSFYSSSDSYSKGEIVEYDGVYWIALQSTTGNSPPTHDGSTASNNIDANWAFYGYDDDVVRYNNTSSDYTGTPVINGVAYGMAYRVMEHISNFIEGTTPNPDDTESDGTLSIQQQALADANDQLDDDIAALETILASREQQLTNSFIRMEEMQSQIQSQQQMLDSSIANNFGQGSKNK